MTKKDYIRIAEAIRQARAKIDSVEKVESVEDLMDGTAYCAEYIASALADENQLFDRARFLAACGVVL